MKLWLAVLVFVFVLTGNVISFPTHSLIGTVEARYDRALVIGGQKFSPGGSYHLLPDWVQPGVDVQLLYICDELADCYYIDVVREGEEFPLMPKIESGAMTADDVFPKR